MICTAISVNSIEQKLISKVFDSYGDVKAKFFECFSDSVSFLEMNYVEVVFLGITGNGNSWEEQCEMIKMIDKATKIVLISDKQIDAVKAFELEATDFLLEPITEKRLEVSLQRTMAS